MDINFELYKIFYHTAKLGSFSEAAGVLFISQSAVSQSIKGLEDKLGTPLFYRKARSIQLTKEGEVLFKHIEQAYNFIRAAETKLLEMQNLELGEIRIGASDTVCKYHLVPIMEKYNALYPNIKINIVNRTSRQIIDALKNGLIDFGIVTLPVNEKHILAEEFMSVEDIFVASSKFSSLKGRKIPLQQLSKQPLLMLPGSSTTRQVLDSCLSQYNVTVTAEIELESIDLLVEFSKIGLGIAHVLRESAAALIEKGELFEIETEESLPRRKLGIITTESVPLSRASTAFIQLLKEENPSSV